MDRARGLHPPVQVLDQDLRRGLRHGRGLRHRHVLPVRHQLESFLRHHRPRARTPDGLRGTDRLLSRGRLSRRHAVRSRPGRQAPAFHGHRARRLRHLPLGHVDPVGQQLDAHAGGFLRRCRHRPVPAGGLVRDRLQPLLSVPPRAHRDGRLPHHGAGGRRCRRLAPDPQAPGQRGGQEDVLDGDVDAGAGRAAADRPRRPARHQYPRAPATEGHGDGGALRKPRERRAADPRRHRQHRGKTHRLRHPDSEAVEPDPQARSECTARGTRLASSPTTLPRRALSFESLPKITMPLPALPETRLPSPAVRAPPITLS